MNVFQRIYKKPFLLWSILLHTGLGFLIFYLLPNLNLYPAKEKNLVTVSLIPESQLNQRLKPISELNNKIEDAKPKPLTNKDLPNSSIAANKTQLGKESAQTLGAKVSEKKSELPIGTTKIGEKNPFNNSNNPLNNRQQKENILNPDNQVINRILKTLDDIKSTPDSKGQAIANRDIKTQNTRPLNSNKNDLVGDKETLNDTELLALRRQLANCWDLPAGVRNLESYVVVVTIEFNRDRSVKTILLQNKDLLKDPIGRIMAESALRSFEKPTCRKLALPIDKYNTWRKIEFTFDPKFAL